MQLYQRIAIVAAEFAGSKKALAEAIGIGSRAFQYYFNEKKESNLWVLLPKILKLYPSISRNWLYFGEGSITGEQEMTAPFTSRNHSDELIGDLLYLALDELGLSKEEAARKAGIPIDLFQKILRSECKPTFEQLEALHSKLNINPLFLFNAEDYKNESIIPQNELLRVYFALGIKVSIPTSGEIQDIFDVGRDEAEEFIREWKEFFAKGENFRIPPEWLKKLEMQKGLSAAWVLSGKPPYVSGIKKESSQAQSNYYNPEITIKTVPVVGLASCGVQGLEQVMPFAMVVSPVILSKDALAVVASGESMVPAGIASGQICYCDPVQEPQPGEAVFFKQKNGLGALKIYMGQSKPGFMSVKGWLSPSEQGERKAFIMDISTSMVEMVAPVIFIRRRL